jgi:Protein of unknown function (DUF2934)
MSTAGLQVCKAELWQAYREAFQEFARRVEELESVKTTGNADRTSVDRALLELERARVHYHQSRDAIASVLLSGRPSRFAEVQSSTRPRDDNQRVREIAQLLWEFEARREGFADDDWYRAEEIIRSARAADTHSASQNG